jgi:hypothetical protein
MARTCCAERVRPGGATSERAGRTRPPAIVSWVGEAAVLLPGPVVAVAVWAPAGAAVASAASSTASSATPHRERTVIAGAR